MTRIEAQLLKSRKRYAALLEKKKHQKLKQLERERKKKKKNLTGRGRPRLKPKLLERARKLARTTTLPDVALRLDIATSTLYSYGITRKAVNAEIALEAAREAKNKK